MKCTDCEARATQYDHREYAKPLEVEPVCAKHNRERGPASDWQQVAPIPAYPPIAWKPLDQILTAKVRVLDTKRCWGHDLFLITPVAGFGQQWVRHHKLIWTEPTP